MGARPAACPRCGAATIIRSGHARGKQRWRCKGCGLQFTRTTPRGGEARGHPAVLHGSVDERHREALRRRGAERAALGARPRRPALPAPGAGARHRLRGRARRGLALRQEKADQLWIWQALARPGGRLIDWECGGRDGATLDRLLRRLERWGVRLYCTDEYAPYDRALPAGRHYVGKDETVMSEQSHARLRHWCARFRRRTVVVSRSAAMVDRTVALFAHYRCNGATFGPALLG
jgi:insertion element IS1 protein InsB